MQVKEKAKRSKARRHAGEMQMKDVARGSKQRLKLRIITAIYHPQQSTTSEHLLNFVTKHQDLLQLHQILLHFGGHIN